MAGNTKDAGTADGAGPAKKSRKKLLLLIGVAAVIAVGGGWFFFLREPGPPPPVEAGAVMSLEPVSVNLTEGHYLKTSLGLQLTLEASEEEPSPAIAADLAVKQFTGRSMAELEDAATREAIQQELTARIVEAYHDEVMDVYFTEFVMQ